MQDNLIRHELPIQSVDERDQDCIAIVPVHRDILNLSEGVRTDKSLIADARQTVKDWYNEDMEYYLRILKKDGQELSWLKDYEEFKDEWELTGTPDKNGFLNLLWKENGASHEISYIIVPVVFENIHDDSGKFYTPQFIKQGNYIEIFYRGLMDSEQVFMSPDKMKRYGIENRIAKIDEDKGIVQVCGTCFSSDYHENMAKTLLLRNFAVAYLNNLLEVGKETIKNN